MEETIGYEALFSAQEWDAITTGHWSNIPAEGWGDSHDEVHVSSGAAANGSGSAADCDQAAPEGPSSEGRGRGHSAYVFNPPGQHEGDEERFDVECDLCGWLTAADTAEEADAIARLHEQFITVLVELWDVER